MSRAYTPAADFGQDAVVLELQRAGPEQCESADVLLGDLEDLGGVTGAIAEVFTRYPGCALVALRCRNTLAVSTRHSSPTCLRLPASRAVEPFLRALYGAWIHHHRRRCRGPVPGCRGGWVRRPRP